MTGHNTQGTDAGQPTSLLRKLGLEKLMSTLLANAPVDHVRLLGELAAAVSDGQPGIQFIHLFALRRADLADQFPELRRRLAPDGALWVSWAKRSSGVMTDLTENVVREVGLANGLVDVKVVSIDETWSALKSVFRLADRKAAPSHG